MTPNSRTLRNTTITALLAAVGVMSAAAGQDALSAALAKVDRYRSLAKTAASPAAMLAPGGAQPDRGDLLDALAVFQKEGLDRSNDTALLHEYAELLELLGYYDLAGETHERRAVLAPENAAVWAAAGRAWAQAGAHGLERALNALQKALDLSPDNGEAWFWLGHLRHREGLYDAAREAYARALDKTPGLPRAVIGMAALDLRAGDILKASQALDALGQAAQPHDVETRTLLRKALYDYESARGFFADEAPLHAAYARLLYRAGRLPDAALAAKHASEMNPADADTLNFLGAVLLQMGSVEQAAQAYEKSLAARPNQPSVEQALTQLRGTGK